MTLVAIIKLSGTHVWSECWQPVGVGLVSIMLSNLLKESSNWANGEEETHGLAS